MGDPEEPDEPARRESCLLGFLVGHASVSVLSAWVGWWEVIRSRSQPTAGSRWSESRRAEPGGDERAAGSSGEQRAYRGHMRISMGDGHGGRSVVGSYERDRGAEHAGDDGRDPREDPSHGDDAPSSRCDVPNPLTMLRVENSRRWARRFAVWLREAPGGWRDRVRGERQARSRSGATRGFAVGSG
jgi:hypothetical protein